MIRKAIFVETGTYNDMALRPYQTNMDVNIARQFQEATDFGRSVTPDNVGSIAGNFLKPMAQAVAPVSIANGWDVPRLRFMIEVEHPSASGFASLRQIITGYTDHVGVSPSGAVNYNMRLYFNNVITLRQVQDETPYGSQIRAQVADASHVLTGQFNPAAFGQADNSLYTMRPGDIFGYMAFSYLGDEVIDTRPSFGEGPVKKSKRRHGSAPEYVSKVVEAYENTMQDDESTADDFSRIMNRAKGQVSDSLVSSDPFLMEAGKQTSFSEGGSMAYGELNNMYPSLDHVAQIILAKSVVQSGVPQNHQRGSTEYWHSSNTETITATILSNSVPSLMMDLMLTRVAFMATNRTLTGDYDIRLADARSFTEGLDLSPYLQRFMARLEVEVLRGLSSNNMIDFEISMTVDVLGETHISISMAGGPKYDYVTPSFCDALMAPVLTNNNDNLRAIGNDIEQLVSNIGTVYGAPQPINSGGGSNDFQFSI